MPTFYLNKTASLALDHHDLFADLDRYSSDRMEAYTQLRETTAGYDVSFQVNAAQLGIASYVHYWHYTHEELPQARKTFNQLKKISREISQKVEYEKIPFSVIGPIFRTKLYGIDDDHKESSGLPTFNEAIHVQYEPDWRETIYGNRYPGHNITNLNHLNANTEEIRQIKTEKIGRDRVINHPRAKDPWVCPITKWTIG